MEKKQNNNPILNMVSDMLLAMFAVTVIGGTFVGLNVLSPILRTTGENTGVLGAKSTEEQVIFFPAVETLPFINESSLQIGTDSNQSAQLRLALNPLEKTTYEFSAITVKNTSSTYKTVQIVPQFSLFNSFTTVSLKTDGQYSTLIDAEGQVFPLDYAIAPNSTVTLQLVIQPSEKLASPTNLTLDFTQRQ